MVHQITVSLEELYNGATRKLAVQKNCICERCEGKCFVTQLFVKLLCNVDTDNRIFQTLKNIDK